MLCGCSKVKQVRGKYDNECRVNEVTAKSPGGVSTTSEAERLTDNMKNGCL